MSNYYLKLVVRLLLIFITMALLAWILTDPRLFFSKVILIGILLLQVIEFIRFIRKTHVLLSQFVDGLIHHDFAQSFPRKSWGAPFDRLFTSMEKIMADLRTEEYAHERRIQYLNMAFDTMDTGLISIEDEDNVVLINERGKEILGVQGLTDFTMIRRLHPNFYKAVDAVRNGGHVLVKIQSGEDTLELSLNAVALQIRNHKYLQVTFRDIREALDTKEIEAWNKLTRILTHEIMNSVTPISSLSETMEAQLKRHRDAVDSEIIADLQYGLGTIQRRSEGLLEFVENYRKLSRISGPDIKELPLNDVIDDQKKLWSREFEKSGIALNASPTNIRLNADRSMLEQILLNLIKNSESALSDCVDPAINIRFHTTGNWIRVDVEDNGKGIDSAELKEIFVPFFTTRQNGSGIGLSLTKQMMHLHGGKVTVKSEPGKGTCMSLWFPNDRTGE